LKILHLGHGRRQRGSHEGRRALYWRSQWAAWLREPWTCYRRASCLAGTFRSRLPADCWASGFPGRRGHLCAGCLPALLHRAVSSVGLLRGKPQADFLEGASAGVWFVLWRRGGTSNESCRFAALRASRPGTLYASRPDSRVACTHGRDRAAHFLQRSAVFAIDVLPLSVTSLDEKEISVQR
jgi:hypothetical protein